MMVAQPSLFPTLVGLSDAVGSRLADLAERCIVVCRLCDQCHIMCRRIMILESANEVCVAVAEHISGSVDAFVELMNQKAASLG